MNLIDPIVRLILAVGTLILPLQTTALIVGPNSFGTDKIFECVSKDVWDAGYVFRFQTPSCEADGTMNVRSDLYEITTIWTPKRIFEGELSVVRSNNSKFQFSIVDRYHDPLIAIQFDVEGTPLIEVQIMNGDKPNPYSTLKCDPHLLATLSEGC